MLDPKNIVCPGTSVTGTDVAETGVCPPEAEANETCPRTSAPLFCREANRPQKPSVSAIEMEDRMSSTSVQFLVLLAILIFVLQLIPATAGAALALMAVILVLVAGV